MGSRPSYSRVKFVPMLIADTDGAPDDTKTLCHDITSADGSVASADSIQPQSARSPSFSPRTSAYVIDGAPR